ncbi:MAG: flagellar hook capping FlgD N-terminal domain-containing protein [Opitutaceae bacterium]
MSTSPITSGSPVPTIGGTAPAARAPKHSLDANDFMKLLSVQMQNQDPMKPMDNNEHMAQVAQMGSMQSIAQMTLSVAQMNAGQTLVLANSYLGQQVSLTDRGGNVITGQVTAVDGREATPQIMVDGTFYPLSAVTRVELPAPPTAANPTT